MSRTGLQLLAGLSRYIGDDPFPQGLTPSASGSTTTIVDSDLTGFGDDYFNGWYVRITLAGADQYKVLRVTDFVGSTGTLTFTPAITSTTTSTTYELHKIDPHAKFSALDEARFTVYPALYEDVWDDTVTADGLSSVFDIPSAIRRGPVAVWEESPQPADADWNFLPYPNGDATTGYTATGTTASTVSTNDTDLLVPKYGHTETKLVTAGSQAATYTCAIANAANGLTAALAGDRQMAHARWVYCTEASKVRLQIIDDAATTSGNYHGGAGWELLTVERTIDGDNATTLSAVVDISSTANPSTIYVARGWWYFGATERVSECYKVLQPHQIRRDDNTQQIRLTYTPRRGRQIRMKGRGVLSALGAVIATQATATMEVDEFTSEILFAEATKTLFRRLSMNLTNFPELAQRIALNDRELESLKKKWGQQPSEIMRVVGMMR